MVENDPSSDPLCRLTGTPAPVPSEGELPASHAPPACAGDHANRLTCSARVALRHPGEGVTRIRLEGPDIVSGLRECHSARADQYPRTASRLRLNQILREDCAPIRLLPTPARVSESTASFWLGRDRGACLAAHSPSRLRMRPTDSCFSTLDYEHLRLVGFRIVIGIAPYALRRIRRFTTPRIASAGLFAIAMGRYLPRIAPERAEPLTPLSPPYPADSALSHTGFVGPPRSFPPLAP